MGTEIFKIFFKFTDFPLRLEKILKFPIKKVVLVQYQRVMEIDPGAHGIRLDVYANDSAGTRYSVEMQKRNEYNIGKRGRYYP